MRTVTSKRLFQIGTACLILFGVFLLTIACGTNPVSNAGSTSNATTAGTTAVTEAAGAEETAAEKGISVEKEAVSTKRTQERVLAGCPELEEDGPIAQDWESYAEDSKVAEEEAARRMRLQECYAVELGNLEQKLKRNEDDSFAGLWIAHEPEYRFVVLFTKNGQQKMEPYLEGEPYGPLVEVRSGAEATLVELSVAQRKAGRIVDRLGYRADSSLNITKNRAELYVTDRDKFRAGLRKAGLQLPEHVVLIEVEGLARPSVPE